MYIQGIPVCQQFKKQNPCFNFDLNLCICRVFYTYCQYTDLTGYMYILVTYTSTRTPRIDRIYGFLHLFNISMFQFLFCILTVDLGIFSYSLLKFSTQESSNLYIAWNTNTVRLWRKENNGFHVWSLARLLICSFCSSIFGDPSPRDNLHVCAVSTSVF